MQGERNIWCKETCFNLATHVPLMIRSPAHASSHGARSSAMVELVDMMPTVIELAGLPPFDPSVKGEPALEGRSLVPLLCGGDSSGAAFSYSFSQYARRRCRSDLFVAKCADAEEQPATFIGYSVRSATHRYTRWVSVSEAGDPSWGSVIGEELYEETSNEGDEDDFDLSERENIVGEAGSAAVLRQLSAALASHHHQQL